MSVITIRNIDPEMKRQLRQRAAAAGRSMEEEARRILRAELAVDSAEAPDLYQRIRRHLDEFGGVDLPIPGREPMRDPPGVDT